MFTRKSLPVLVWSAMLGFSPRLALAADNWVGGEPANDVPGTVTVPFASGDTYSGFIAPADTDYFNVTALTPGSTYRACAQNWPSPHNFGFDLDVFNTTNSDVLANVDVPNAPGTALFCANVVVPANGILGFQLYNLKSGTGEGYRVSLELVPTSIPVFGWPVIPLLGAAAVAELRRRQKRKSKDQAA